jgi:hypothetical protein
VVRETEHTRTSYCVDYYSMYTGDVEPLAVTADDGEHRLIFQRLLNAVEIVTCVDCYRDPVVQRRREQRFRQEDAAQEGDGLRE